MRLAPVSWRPEGGRSPTPTLLACTTRLSRADSADEVVSGAEPRHAQVRALLAALRRLVGDGEPTLVMGDLGDALHPRLALRGVGLVDVFTALGVTHPPTYPAHPHAESDLMYPQLPLDFITAGGGVATLTAQVRRFSLRGAPASDHWPVVGTFELRAPSNSERSNASQLSREGA